RLVRRADRRRPGHPRCLAGGFVGRRHRGPVLLLGPLSHHVPQICNGAQRAAAHSIGWQGYGTYWRPTTAPHLFHDQSGMSVITVVMTSNYGYDGSSRSVRSADKSAVGALIRWPP